MKDCVKAKPAPLCPPSVEQVVDSVGVGWAQIKYLFTAGIFHFNRGIQTGLLTIMTVPMGRAFDLHPVQSGFLSTVMFLGMFTGTMVSGYLGDALGRRVPICTGSTLMVVVTLLTLASHSYIALVFARLMLGICISFGDIPVNTMISEVTPPRWRIAMRAASETFFDSGYTFAALCATLADPKLRSFDWRSLLMLTALPPGIFALFCHYFMPESPVFLASVGRREEAERIFISMARLNRVPTTDVHYAAPAAPLNAAGAGGSSGRMKLGIIFSRKYISMTLIVAYTAFMINVFYYGGMYSQPQVMTKGHGLEAGWEIVIGGPADAAGLLIVTLIGSMLPRRTVLVFALSMAALSLIAFGYGGSIQDRSAMVEVVYQWGVFGFYWVQAMAFVVIGQVAVEAFPTIVATTGASVALSMGRIGGLAAPMLFENVRLFTGRWELFCYGAAAGCFLAVFFLVMFYVQVKPGEESSPEDDGTVLKTIEDGEKPHST